MGRRRKEAIEEGLPEGFVYPGEEEPTSSEELDKLISTLPTSGEVYLKVYKTKPIPVGTKPQFKTEITELSLIEDLEIYIRNLAKESEWGSGEYLVVAIPKNKNIKVPSPCRINIDYDEDKGKDGDRLLKQKFTELKDLLSSIKDIMPQQKDGISSADLSRSMADSFKLGMEVIKSVMPVKDEDSLIKTAETFKTLGILKSNEDNSADRMVNALKEAGLLKKEELDILKVLSMLKELGIIGGKEKVADTWEEIMKLKELGVIKVGGEEDSFSMVDKVKSLMELVESMGGGGAKEKSSMGLKIIELLAPQIPKIIENITGAVSQVAEVSKMKLSRQLGMSGPSPTRYAPSLKPVEKKLVPEITASPYDADMSGILPPSPEEIPFQPPAPHPETVVTRNPMIQEVFNAVKVNNTDFYPQLRDLILIYIGPHALELLITNQVSIENFLKQISTTFNEDFFLGDDATLYFKNFIEWHRADSTKDLVIAKCDACGDEFEYHSIEEFEADDKNCECGEGKLELKAKNVGTA